MICFTRANRMYHSDQSQVSYVIRYDPYVILNVAKCSKFHRASLSYKGYLYPCMKHTAAPIYELIDPALGLSIQRQNMGVPRCIMGIPPVPIAKALAWRVTGASVARGIWAWLGARGCGAWPCDWVLIRYNITPPTRHRTRWGGSVYVHRSPVQMGRKKRFLLFRNKYIYTHLCGGLLN